MAQWKWKRGRLTDMAPYRSAERASSCLCCSHTRHSPLLSHCIYVRKAFGASTSRANPKGVRAHRP
jgi:hypothetical protein